MRGMILAAAWCFLFTTHAGALDFDELQIAGEFAKFVLTHEEVAVVDETDTSMIKLDEFMYDLEGDLRDSVQRLRYKLRSIGRPELIRHALNQVVEDLASGGHDLNEIILTFNQHERDSYYPRFLQEHLPSLFWLVLRDRQYIRMSARAQDTPDLFNLTYPEPLNFAIESHKTRARNKLEHQHSTDQRITAISYGLLSGLLVLVGHSHFFSGSYISDNLTGWGLAAAGTVFTTVVCDKFLRREPSL